MQGEVDGEGGIWQRGVINKRKYTEGISCRQTKIKSIFFCFIKIPVDEVFEVLNPVPVGLFLSDKGWGGVDSTPPWYLRMQCTNKAVIQLF